MMSRKSKIVYVEPADYFPKEIRKKYKLGEYDDERDDRFVWKEGEATLYDKDGNRIDPKTGKAIIDANDPHSEEIRQLVKEWQERKKGAQNE